MHTTTEAAPAHLKKRNVGKVITAGVATFAGIALAATVFNVTQDGSATFTPEYEAPVTPPTPIDDSNYSVTDMDLGDLTGSSQSAQVTSSFQLVNDSDERGEAMLIGVEGDSSDLFGSIWVVITRQDPTNGGGPDQPVYDGYLSELNGTYMGDVVARGAQTFNVSAYVIDGPTSDTEDPEALDTSFTVHYGVYGYTEREPADQVRKGLEGA